MSLINQMLQDLDARRAEGAGRAALPSDVRPLPVERRSLWMRIALGVIVAGLLTEGAILWLHAPAPTATAPVPAPQAGSAAVAPVPAAAGTSVQAAQESRPSTPGPGEPRPIAAAVAPVPVAAVSPPAAVAVAKEEAAVPAEPVPEPKAASAQPKAEQARPGQEGRLKVATSLSVPAGLVERAPAAAAVPRASPPAVAAAVRPEKGPPSIEKQIHTPSARDRAEGEYRKASGLLNQGRLNEAVAGFHAALQEDPGHANARLALLGILVEQKKLDEAQSLAQEGLALNPAQPPLAMRLARIQIERGDTRGAAETLQKATGPASAANAEFRGFYAAVLQRLGRHKEAAEEYQAALRLAPQASVWWMGLGISFEAEGRTAEARDAYQRAKATGALTAELGGFVDGKLRQLQ